jgi:hypothetical protein
MIGACLVGGLVAAPRAAVTALVEVLRTVAEEVARRVDELNRLAAEALSSPPVCSAQAVQRLVSIILASAERSN